MKKHNNRMLPRRQTGRARRRYFTAVTVLTLCAVLAVPALAADDPLAIINNLSDFVFSCILAVGVIILGWGIV